MSVDRGDLQVLIRDLGAVPPAIRRAARPAMFEAGRPVLDRIRAAASWSTRIPAATTMRLTTAAGVEFRTDATRAPHARPYEGLSGSPFRAPLWGDREHWYPHDARPFFYRTATEGAAEMADKFADALMGVAEQHGF